VRIVAIYFLTLLLVELMEIMQNGLHLNGSPDVDMDFSSGGGSLRFSSGLILPPPEIKCMFTFNNNSNG
jgi:hypothetical protein